MDNIKTYLVEYDHNDGRKGIVEVTTKLIKSTREFEYGNGYYGKLYEGNTSELYDLRYIREKDLHLAMIKDYFGSGLVKVTEK